MATQLIKHLKICAEADEIYKPLESQWAFDERLIAKALQNVCVYFPHYSRHDESHSRQILVHIERLLGENLTKLTATDTWLLLEAAYLHDIGMVVTDEQLNKNFEEIKKHAESMKYSANEDLLSVINALSTSKSNTAAIFSSVNLKAFQTLKLLREIIADYYRKKHPEQAGKIITHPLLEIGLDSPRNELLPTRFFGLLSKICEYHGASFEKVMELPQRQVGMGTEDCHPRFIACLLRLGDLLDLDDNRFCPVMLKMAGHLPDLSEAHHKKHLSIRHFRADPDRIEIEAECPDYESYIETSKWFSWLREEVKNQMSRWFDIVPTREFGLLPSIGDLKPHLKNWQVFNENQRPHFELDSERIFELLQGAGLYKCKEQAMRELLQNAVDATLIRIWREHGEDCLPKPEPSIARNSAPRDEDIRKILDKYSIDVTIEKEKEKEGGEFNYWRITIADQGTGISREDLKFMMQMGSSKKNSKRREIIEKMPVWMKPSGIFGIGLHSVFLLTNEVLIETRSIDTGETLVIRLTDPTDRKEHGNVYFQIVAEPKEIELANNKKQKFKPWDFSHYGSQLSFIYKTNKNVIPSYRSGNAVDIALENYDGLVDSTGDFYIINIIHNIFLFFNYSFLTGSLRLIDENQNSYEKSENNNLKNKNHYYLVNENIELIYIQPSSRSDIDLYYRGQKIDDHIYGFNFLEIKINLLDDEADKLLTISRNKFKDWEAKQDTFNRIVKVTQEFFNSEVGRDFYASLEIDDQAKIAAEHELQGWDKPSYFDWTQLLVDTQQGLKKISELGSYTNILCFDDNFIKYAPDALNKLNNFIIENLCEKSICEKSISIPRDNARGIYFLLQKFLKSQGFKSTYFIKDELKIVKLNKENKAPFSENLLFEYCKQLLPDKRYFNNFCLLKRDTIPCLEEYTFLALEKPNLIPVLKDDSHGDWVSQSFDLDLISPRMLFPLARINDVNGDRNKDKITVGDLDILAKRVYKNRADKNTTEEQIKEKYQEFIAFLDDLMKDEDEWRELRGEEFNRYKKAN